MNFFGHAVVAAWSPSTAPAELALGAMLPDLRGMAGGGELGVLPGELQRGVALHHATDAVFHVLPAVSGLMRDLGLALAARGVARGPMRAAAHLGVELLLDGVLARAGATQHYQAALEVAVPEQVAAGDGALAGRWAELMRRLRDAGVPTNLAEPAVAARRIVRAIAHRPRLAATSAEAGAIEAALGECLPRVEVAREAIMRGLLVGLARA